MARIDQRELKAYCDRQRYETFSEEDSKAAAQLVAENPGACYRTHPGVAKDGMVVTCLEVIDAKGGFLAAFQLAAPCPPVCEDEDG